MCNILYIKEPCLTIISSKYNVPKNVIYNSVLTQVNTIESRHKQPFMYKKNCG